MQEQRIWTCGPPASAQQKQSTLTPLHIWDAGGEVWELHGNEVRHYRVIDRVFLNKEMTRVKETLERLEESAIPKEIYAKHSRADMLWKIEPAAVEESAEAKAPAVWELTSLAPWIPANVLLPVALLPSEAVADAICQ
jgi:hypothetical protein